MPRKLRPCGTPAAYARHLYNKEEPCGPCKAANMERCNNAPSGNNHEVAKWDAILAAEQPVITWRRKNNGIWVATSVRDPHAETGAQSAWDQRMAREELRLQQLQDEADEVAERFRQHRANNTTLMASARREI